MFIENLLCVPDPEYTLVNKNYNMVKKFDMMNFGARLICDLLTVWSQVTWISLALVSYLSNGDNNSTLPRVCYEDKMSSYE